MKQSILFACSLILLQTALLAQAGTMPAKAYYPAPLGFVSDFENDFTMQQTEELDSTVKAILIKIKAHPSLAGIELAVVTVTDSMFGSEKEMSDYATKLGDQWEVGKKSHRAIIIAYSKKVRKVAIAVGSGLDKILPGASCQQIMSYRMAPEFKKGTYFNAIKAALAGLEEALKLN
jgi:uncharacterized protein